MMSFSSTFCKVFFPSFPIYVVLALTCSGLGSQVEGTRDVRGSYMKPPHLLVVSTGNSFDRGPARSGREIVPHPPSHVSLDASRCDGHKTSKRRMRGGESGCRRRNEERCLPGRGSAATDRASGAAGHRDAAASALRRRLGLTERFQTHEYLRPREERGNYASQGGKRCRVATVRL